MQKNPEFLHSNLPIMAATAEVTVADLYNLPLSVPELRYLGERSIQVFKYAVYCTVHLASAELQALLGALNTSYGVHPENQNLNDLSCLHPAAVLVNRQAANLQDVLRQHIDWVLAREAGFKDTDEDPFNGSDALHPSSVIAITDADWQRHGVMLVSLCVDGTGDVFAFPRPALEAAAILADIEVGNNSFAEAAECIGAPIPITPTELREEAEKEAFIRQQPLPWDKEKMGRFSLSILYEPSHIYPIGCAINGPLAVNTPVGYWPCGPNGWRHYLRLDLIAEMEAKIAAVVAGHSVWGSRPEYRGLYNEHLFVIADHEEFDIQGVLVGELDDAGGVILERVRVGDVFRVLVAKATARQPFTCNSDCLKGTMAG